MLYFILLFILICLVPKDICIVRVYGWMYIHCGVYLYIYVYARLCTFIFYWFISLFFMTSLLSFYWLYRVKMKYHICDLFVVVTAGFLSFFLSSGHGEEAAQREGFLPLGPVWLKLINKLYLFDYYFILFYLFKFFIFIALIRGPFQDLTRPLPERPIFRFAFMSVKNIYCKNLLKIYIYKLIH